MSASCASMFSLLVSLLVLVNPCAAAGFSLPLVSMRHGLINYSADGFFGYDVQQQQELPPELTVTTIRPPMAKYGWSHAVQVGVGTGQGRNFYMLELDINGEVTWMQCRPSNPELAQASPIFDTSASPSFASVSPRSPMCRAPYLPQAPDKCEFKVLFHDASARGYLGTEEFAFASSSGGNAETLDGVVFGCAHSTRGFQNHGTLAGVLSMSTHWSSLIGQVPGVSRFSYCLSGDWTRPGFLRLGDDITYPPSSDMRSVPIITRLPHGRDFVPYSFDVLGVALDGRKLTGITAHMFEGNNHLAGGCRIDVGVPATRMVQAAYNILQQEVLIHMHSHGVERVTVLGHRLCFADGEGIRQHLPTMALELHGGATYDITPEKLFMAVSQGGKQYLCLAIVPDERQTVLGVMQQVNMQFVFDINTYNIFFAPVRC